MPLLYPVGSLHNPHTPQPSDWKAKCRDACCTTLTKTYSETEAITASFTETTLIIDEESLQKFLCWHETLPTKEYIQTLEQLFMNQAEICKLSLEVIELQKQDLQHQQKNNRTARKTASDGN